MDKKGILLAEETLKIVIAVISIAFLAYFLSALYFSKVNDDKLRFAENNIELIGDIVSSLGEEESVDYDLINPRGWFLLSFTGSIKPNSCAGQTCLCVCDGVSENSLNSFVTGEDDKEERQAEQCIEKGSCLIVKELREIPLEIEIKGVDELILIEIKKENGRVLVQEKR